MPMIVDIKSRPSIQGFTLIEVMICLFILAVGLLGMAALQNETLKYNHTAFIESQAQFLLTDMAERIRANRGNDAYVLDFTEAPPAQTKDCGVVNANCSTNEMVIWDLNQWRVKVEDTHYLPQGQSRILYDAPSHMFTISIRYDSSQLGGVDVTNGQRTVSITTRM